MSIRQLQELLNSDKNIKINCNLLRELDVEQALLYSYLLPIYQKSMLDESYKYFNNDMYISYPIDDIEQELGLSPFKQRKALSKLEKTGLIKIKIGQARAKYISINEDTSCLKQILCGNSFERIAKDLYTYIGQQIKTFSTKNNLDFDSKYLINPNEIRTLIEVIKQEQQDVYMHSWNTQKNENKRLVSLK